MYIGIECISLNRSFGDPPLEVLKAINFQIPKGQFGLAPANRHYSTQ